MKVYIAAPWVRRPEAIAVGQRFEAAGHEVTSRWFFHEVSPGGAADATGSTSPREMIQQQAREDIEDVRRADVFVVLNLERTEGKAVETGIALAAHIPVFSVGPRSNIFQTLGIEVDTVDHVLAIFGCRNNQALDEGRSMRAIITELVEAYLAKN